METVKKCVQCLKTKDVNDFRPYYSRSKYKDASKVGRQTVCYACERINSSATAALRRNNPGEKLVDDLKQYYRLIPGKVPTVGMRLLGLHVERTSSELTDALQELKAGVFDVQVSGLPEHISNFMIMIKGRRYVDSDEAWDRFKELLPELQAAGVDKEAEGLIADWEAETW